MYSAKGYSEHKEERGRLKGQCEIIVSRKNRTIAAVRHRSNSHLILITIPSNSLTIPLTTTSARIPCPPTENRDSIEMFIKLCSGYPLPGDDSPKRMT